MAPVLQKLNLLVFLFWIISNYAAMSCCSFLTFVNLPMNINTGLLLRKCFEKIDVFFNFLLISNCKL